jgi:predicted phosphoribosyltransferase
MERRFRDRVEAGRLLAERLQSDAGRDDVVVLALPRGGVPVAYEVAKALGVPLGVFVRKLGVPRATTRCGACSPTRPDERPGRHGSGVAP